MVEIPGTRNKLNEAAFFFDHLAHNEKRVRKNVPEASEYFLSAFLSAARSVTLYLQVEQKARYDAWSPEWLKALSDDERQLLKHHNEQRRLAIHRLGPEIEAAITQVPLGFMAKFDHPEFGSGRFFGTASTQLGGSPATIGRQTLSFKMPHDVDVTASCSRYLILLRRLIADFEEYWKDRPEPNDKGRRMTVIEAHALLRSIRPRAGQVLPHIEHCELDSWAVGAEKHDQPRTSGLTFVQAVQEFARRANQP